MVLRVHEPLDPSEIPDDRTTQETICPSCVARDARVLTLAELVVSRGAPPSGGLRITIVVSAQRGSGGWQQSWSGAAMMPTECGNGRLLRATDCVNEDEVLLELLAQAEGRR